MNRLKKSVVVDLGMLFSVAEPKLETYVLERDVLQ